MAARELVVLGSASQVPTRARNHNGYFLRWDDEGILFDPGEGTQRQMLLAGVPASSVSRICITHLHGDHCLGLPGVLQRMSLDGVSRAIPVAFPASGGPYIDRLRHASIFDDRLDVRIQPVPVPHSGDVPPVVVTVDGTDRWTLRATPLRHAVDAVGWRLEEHPDRTMLPERLADAGIEGPDVGRLQRDGEISVGGRRVTLAETSAERRGQVFAFVMDTAWCEGAVALAEGADLLVCEATFASSEAELATAYGHLTAVEAGRLAAEAGVGLLLLTHFSQRYPDVTPLVEEAASAFGGEVVAAEDLRTVTLPARRTRRNG
ncbi:MAG TPA: ribonuclease Z [Acidimicrobiales bacterium]|nr:ribonuclease Z [Acidimicrobiales bacterium]